MTDNTTDDKQGIAAAESAVIMPPDKPAQKSYCVKTVQETSASVIRMWLICLTYLLPNFACGLAMTFSVTGLPHYQDVREDSAASTSASVAAVASMASTGSNIILDEDQESWFGMGFLNATIRLLQ